MPDFFGGVYPKLLVAQNLPPVCTGGRLVTPNSPTTALSLVIPTAGRCSSTGMLLAANDKFIRMCPGRPSPVTWPPLNGSAQDVYEGMLNRVSRSTSDGQPTSSMPFSGAICLPFSLHVP